MTLSAQPDEGTDKAEKAEVTPSELFKSGEDATIMLDLVEEAFDYVALPIQIIIIVTRLLAVGSGRNDRNCPTLDDQVEKRIGVIGLVSNLMVRLIIGN